MSKLAKIKEVMGSNIEESFGTGGGPPLISIGKNFGESGWQDAADRSRSVFVIPIEKIVPDPGQPRQEFNEEELGMLAATIRKNGLIQPIAVRPDPENERWIVISGERRWRAAKLAGLDAVEAREMTGLNTQQIRLLQLVENCARADLNPLEKARGIQALIDETGWTQKQAAEYLGISPAHVSQTLRLLELPDEKQKEVARGDLTATEGLKLAREVATELPDDPVQRRKQAIREGRRFTPRSSKNEWSLPDGNGKVSILLRKTDATSSDYRAALRHVLRLLEGKAKNAG